MSWIMKKKSLQFYKAEWFTLWYYLFILLYNTHYNWDEMGVSGLSSRLTPQFGEPKSRYSIILSELVAS